MDIKQAIEQRKSARHFTADDITDDELKEILEAGRQAPSGLNNQPWRFIVVKTQDGKDKIAEFSKYGRVIRDAKLLVVVLFDASSGYHREKDMHSIGACIQNMWLMAWSLGIGMCWVGEILNRKKDVESALNLGDEKELMAVLCFGRPIEERLKETDRLPLEKLVVGEI